MSTPLLARPWAEVGFKTLALGAVAVALVTIATLITNLIIDGWARLGVAFFTGYPSRHADKAGIASALLGSFYLMLLVGIIAIPLGVATAIYLEEYAPRNRFTRLIELNLVNLAGVPSIIYGLLGLELFVRFAGFDRSLLAGACTLSLLVLPVIVMSAREAIKTVPKSLREGSLALGATRWQTIRLQVLPVAFPGILTGCILAFSRAIGETAPLITIGALTYVGFAPDGIFSAFTVLPVQAYNWISRPQPEFHANAAAAILVLLAVLLTLNSVAIILRSKLQKRRS